MSFKRGCLFGKGGEDAFFSIFGLLFRIFVVSLQNNIEVHVKMKNVSAFVLSLFVAMSLFSQEAPCNFTEVEEMGKVVYKGEKNYINTEYKELRICLQFQYSQERYFIAITTEGDRKMVIDSSNVAYVQLENGKEYILRPHECKYDKDGMRLECRYVVAKEDERDFANIPIKGIFFSSDVYPQIDIADLNNYTARKLREKFNCAYTAFNKQK